jgi:multidrug resistance efflux pump
VVITAVGIFAGLQLWQRYMLTPWTRDGRVLANSVSIASEVSGRIVQIRVRENQSVKKGEILFIIDQSTYKAALDSAEASVAAQSYNNEKEEVMVTLTRTESLTNIVLEGDRETLEVFGPSVQFLVMVQRECPFSGLSLSYFSLC